MLRFDHAGRTYAQAHIEKAAEFLPRLAKAAATRGDQTATRVFVSDFAEWIELGVKAHVPDFVDVADRFHIRQHLYTTAEALYGKKSPRAKKWSASMAKRLAEQGGGSPAGRLRRLKLYYADLTHQRAALNRAAFLDRHAEQLHYPEWIARDLPVDCGGIDSLCKQLGTRLKAGGRR